MTTANIDKLSKKQLKDLQLQIERKLYGFWDIVKELAKVEREEADIQKYIEGKKDLVFAKSEQMQALDRIGFTIVIHKNDRVSIINYSKPKKNDEFYGITFDKETNSILSQEENPLSDEDMKKIKEILEIE